MLVQVFTRSHGATEPRSFEYVPTNQFMPKRYKDSFEQVVSLENLFAAARKAMRGKRGKAPAAGCFADLERVVVDLRVELVSGSKDPHQDGSNGLRPDRATVVVDSDASACSRCGGSAKSARLK